MATPATLPKPGVKIYTEFRNATPTLVVPQMPACVMGIAREIVEGVTDAGNLNPQANLSIPARVEFPFVSSPFQYATLGTETLQISINNSPTYTITFPLTNPNVNEVKAHIDGLAIPGLLVDIEESGAEKRVVLRTSATGPFASLAVMGGSALSILDLRSGGYTEFGRSGYNNYFALNLGRPSYPNPRGNLEELTIDFDSVRGFLATGGGGFTEVSKTSSFLRGATAAVSVFDDGDGDNLSPYLDFAGQNFTVGPAVLTGSANLSLTFGALNGDTASFSIDGGPTFTATFTAPASAADIITAINTAAGSTVATLGAGNVLVISSPTSGPDSTIERIGGNAASGDLGVAVGAFANGRQSRARLAGSVDLTGLTYGPGGDFDPQLSLIMSIDGGPEQTLFLTQGLADEVALVAAINEKWQVPSGDPVASLNGNGALVLRSPNLDGGEESVIRISGQSTALTVLGLTATRVAGNAYAPEIGDEVYANGIRLGLVTEVAPAGVVNRLRLDTENLLTYTAVNFAIYAKGLAGAQSATRPSADLVVDPDSGELVFKHEVFRTPAGAPTQAVDFNAYLGFNALRRDVSPAGANANVLRVGTISELEDKLSPVSPENPLALGLYYAILNSSGLETQALGVSATSEDEPYGTLSAWAEAFEFIESKDVYALAPLTHSLEVADLAAAHVTAMSDPENGLERAVFFNPVRPTRNPNELVASGSTGNSTGGVSTFDTGIANLPALLASAGYPAPPFDIDDRIFLRLDNDTNNYLVTGVSGSVVTVSTGALAAGTSEDNTDGFYFDGGAPAFPSPIVDRPFSVAVRGTLLANLTEEAIAYASLAQRFQNRRVVVTTPDKATSTLSGLDQIIEGFYMNAALAGKTASKLPQDPLTEVSILGFTGVVGGTDRYGELQYRIMDGGGLWSMYQEKAGQNIKTRHQLTTDMSTIEKREFSILTALDFGAKFVRGCLRNFIGRYNITTNVETAISVNFEGIKNFLVSQGVFKFFQVDKVRQDPNLPDNLLVDVSVGIYYPLNELKVTFII